MGGTQLVGRESELGAVLGYVEQGIDKIVLVLGPESSEADVLEWIQSGVEECKDLGMLEVIKQLAYDHSSLSQPVFIIDQAERMLDLFPRPKAVIDILAGIARDRKGTVILASRDDSLREESIEQEVVLPFHLGYFSEKAARVFLCKLRAAEDKRWWWQRWWSRQDLVSEEEWHKIYSVCGGCPWLLRDCVSPQQDLDTVLGAMVGSVTMAASIGMEGMDGEWQGDKYRKVAELLVENGGSVEWLIVLDKVFDKDGRECASQLRAMRARGRVHIQYVPESMTKVVMAPSPAYLQAIKMVLEGKDEPASDEE